MSDYLDSEIQNNSHIVLCIEEKDDSQHYGIDSRLFIFWDDYSNDYVISGCRISKYKSKTVPYVLHFENSKAVKTFLQLNIDNRKCNMIYYNFNNLHKVEEYTYEFFEDNIDNHYEIMGYDNVIIEYDRIKSILRMLRDSYGSDN
jgi:hypothetical protein